MCLTKILYKVLPVEFQPQLHPPSASEGLRAGLSAETGLSAAGMDPVQETERLEMYSKQTNKQPHHHSCGCWDWQQNESSRVCQQKRDCNSIVHVSLKIYI